MYVVVKMKTAVLNKMYLFVLLLFASFAAKTQPSQLPDISADRPGMATPPSIIEPKCFQVETGFSFEKNKLEIPFQENILYNSTLLRYGINKNSEIRLQTDYARYKTDSVDITGFIPLTIGTQLIVSEEKGIIPKISILLNFTLPFFGEKNFRPKKLSPSIYLLLQNDILDKLNVCYNIGIEYDGETTPQQNLLRYVLVIALQIS
jgi:hypothetical protein